MAAIFWILPPTQESSRSHQPVTIPCKPVPVGLTRVVWRILPHAGAMSLFVPGFRMWPTVLWALGTVDLEEQVDSDQQDIPLCPVGCRQGLQRILDSAQ